MMQILLFKVTFLILAQSQCLVSYQLIIMIFMIIRNCNLKRNCNLNYYQTVITKSNEKSNEMITPLFTNYY